MAKKKAASKPKAKKLSKSSSQEKPKEVKPKSQKRKSSSEKSKPRTDGGIVPRTFAEIIATEELPSYGKHEDYRINPDFPPPYTGHKFYIARWNENLVKVRARTDFDVSMLSILHQLCNIQLEAEVLEIMVREQGHVLALTGGREGFRIRRNPLVDALKVARDKIREYSLTLGVIKRPRTVIKGNRGTDLTDLDGVDDFDTMSGETLSEAQGEDFDDN